MDKKEVTNTEFIAMLERINTEMSSVYEYLEAREIQLCQDAGSEDELLFAQYTMRSLQEAVMERKTEVSKYICIFQRLSHGNLG